MYINEYLKQFSLKKSFFYKENQRNHFFQFFLQGNQMESRGIAFSVFSLESNSLTGPPQYLVPQQDIKARLKQLYTISLQLHSYRNKVERCGAEQSRKGKMFRMRIVSDIRSVFQYNAEFVSVSGSFSVCSIFIRMCSA